MSQKIRALAAGEAYMWRASLLNSCHAMIVATLDPQLAIDDLEAHIRQRLKQIPQMHWMIQSEEGKPYFVQASEPSELVRRIEGPEADDWETQVREELNSNFRDGEPLVRICLLASPKSPRLLLVFHHALADGQSGMQLLADLMAAPDAPSRAPLGPIEDFLPARPHSLLKYALSYLPQLILRRPLRLNALRDAPLKERKSEFFHQQLSLEETAALIAWARATGVTVHAALVALLLKQALRESNDERGQSKLLACMSPYSLRQGLPAAGREALGLYVTALTHYHHGTSSSSLVALARDVHSQLRVAREEKRGEDLLILQRALGFRFQSDKVTLRTLKALSRFTVSISNLGACSFPAALYPIENAFLVSSSSVFGGTSLGLSVTTVRGKMNWAFACALPLLSRAVLERCAAGMQETLRGLDPYSIQNTMPREERP